MHKPLGIVGLAICFIFSPVVGAAESGAAQTSTVVARAARPGCAKLVCQRRAVSADDRGPSAEQRAPESSDGGVSVVVGVGAGAFWGPRAEYGYVNIDLPSELRDPTSPPPGESGVSAPIDSGGFIDEYEPSGSRRTKLQGPTVSLGVSQAQPLIAGDAWRLGVEERFTLAAVLPLAGGSSFAGFGDILLVTRPAGWPLQFAAGPSLAVAKLDVRDDANNTFYEAGVIAGGAALLRLDLAQAVPGSLDLVGHFGTLLNFEDASYRDLQLAFALRL